MTQSVAVLVDGDNISGKNAAAILGIATEHGDPIIVRAYLDAQRASDWHGAIGYRLVHAGTGKNATDILLAIDAMDLVHAKTAMRFVIASSDGDFTHLAVRLRELGAKVIGVGEAKAPHMFRASCSRFVELGTKPTVKLVPKAPSGIADMDLKIRAMIAGNSKKGAGMPFAEFATKMNVMYGIKTSTLPEKTWRAYLNARPALYDLDPRGPRGDGEVPTKRLRCGGLTRCLRAKCLGRLAEPHLPALPSLNTSMASITCTVGIQHWAGKAGLLLNEMWPDPALGTAQIRDRSSVVSGKEDALSHETTRRPRSAFSPRAEITSAAQGSSGRHGRRLSSLELRLARAVIARGVGSKRCIELMWANLLCVSDP